MEYLFIHWFHPKLLITLIRIIFASHEYANVCSITTKTSRLFCIFHQNFWHLSFLGLGLSTTSSGRRDSFDRNTSAFSPSLDYRSKWTTSYNIGSSPSPLTGSLTPPPAPSLQLGGLVASRVMSAAPGAEAKYRNSVASGLTTNAMFGSTNSLFTKINSLTAVPSTLDKGPQGRSRLLEDFRNNRYPNLQLRYMMILVLFSIFWFNLC